MYKQAKSDWTRHLAVKSVLHHTLDPKTWKTHYKLMMRDPHFATAAYLHEVMLNESRLTPYITSIERMANEAMGWIPDDKVAFPDLEKLVSAAT